MVSLAAVGASGAGKSTLLRALGAKAGAQEVVVELPDPTLGALAEIYKPKRVVHVQMDLEEPVGPRPLPPKARDAQGLVVVVGGFGEEPASAQQQWQQINEEMVVADLVVAEGRLERIAAERAKGRKIPEAELKALEQAKELLGEGRALREAPQLAGAAVLRGFGFWSAKPVVVVVNLGDEAPEPEPGEFEGVQAVGLRCKLEAELMELEAGEREEFMKEMGLRRSAREVLSRAVVRAMGLVTFYTVVGQEVRAWVVPRGTTAWAAAGEIHSDMQRGFIRAEVMDADEVIAAGGEAQLRARGLVKVVGKDYELTDGQVFIVRFSV